MTARAASTGLAVLVCSLVMVGCATPTATGPITEDQPAAIVSVLEVDGLERSYVVHAPADAAEPLPVLVMMHGAGGNADQSAIMTGFDDEAETGAFIAVYPNGTPVARVDGEFAWNADACCGNPRRFDVDDVAFIEAMLDEIAATYAVDESRIYLAGYSNGGMLAYRLACEAEAQFAGIAVVGGSLTTSVCRAPSPTSVLIIHGTADRIVPYLGGESTELAGTRYGQWQNASVAESAGFWLSRNGCPTKPERTIDGPISTDSYDGCIDDLEVDVVSIANGPHAWPALATQGYDASAEILRFFDLD